ncbi:hypothetical protein CC1G_02444 [Coprinopsis cinerea okayama7|uniref:EamA domain-containing protein n=1 Tax=Coprinopsis cinerea (strain Okayama-7 / 130 / ATCC MYA-4618 / FGSC 9003) TaxID=240176 RepID=A8NBI4_COPC7|nr:hypothetical protein CC1G_02444 [Coprinopsis cinerea okayama7\|eukprot:XP_001832182.1 hypothetical protein CC1G_02444 [Coprinopsis cinerea okayama7\
MFHDGQREPLLEEVGTGRTRRGFWKATKALAEDNVGLLLIAAAQIFFSLMNVTVKALNSMDPPVSALELVAVRMGVTWVCCVGYMLVTKVPDPWLGPKGVRLWLLFRGFTGFISLFGMYFSLQYLSLSDATVLQFLSPVFTAIVGALLLKESFTLKQAFAGVVSMAGVILIARPAAIFGPHVGLGPQEDAPQTTSDRAIAVFIALVGVVGATGAYISLRAIGKRAHPIQPLTSHAGQSALVGALGMYITGERFVLPASKAWLAMFGLMGFFGMIAQILLTLGFQREAAGKGSMAIYTQIVFATIFERVFFDAVPPLLSVLGTVLIISSAVYLALLKESNNGNGQSVSAESNLGRGIEQERMERGLLLGSDSESDDLDDNGKVKGREER